MPSLTDIPPQLLPSDQQPAFLEWLQALPVTVTVRRELAYLWIGHTGNPFTHTDWLQALKGALKG